MSETTARASLGAPYRRLLGSAAAANLGDGLMAVALIWLASSLTRDPLIIASIGLASRIPWLVVTLFAGVVTDRVDRRRLVGWMDVVRCGTVAVLAGIVAWRQSDLPTPAALASGADTAPADAPALLVLVGLVALVLGVAEVLRDNAAQTLLPALVREHHLEKANSRLWGVESTMNQFAGPPLAGVLIGVALVVPFGLNAGLLALSAFLVLGLRGDFTPGARFGQPHKPPTATAAERSWRRELAEGFRWLWRHRLLRSLAILLGLMNMLAAAGYATDVLFIQDVLGVLDGWAFGLVMTGSAVGAVLASLCADKIAARLGSRRALLASVLVIGATTGVIALTSSPFVFWATHVLAAFGILTWNVVTVSLRQRLIPDHLLGRVNSVYRFFGWGMMSVGALLGGVLVTLFEAPWGASGHCVRPCCSPPSARSCYCRSWRRPCAPASWNPRRSTPSDGARGPAVLRRRARSRARRDVPDRRERIGQVDAGGGDRRGLWTAPGGRLGPGRAAHPRERVTAGTLRTPDPRPRCRSVGFFLRAETWHGWYTFAEAIGAGPPFHEMSHGESFLEVMRERADQGGFYCLDEPEAALSFSATLGLIGHLNDLVAAGGQVLCATHSPVLASLPGARILELGNWGIRETTWGALDLVDHWRRFLDAPGRYLRHVLDD